MTIEVLQRAGLAKALGYINESGGLRQRAVAQLIRDALGRWGLSPRRELLKHARDQLGILGVEDDLAPRVLEQLIDLGECAEVFVGHERYIAPCERRWLDIGGQEFALLGAGWPAELQEATTIGDDQDVVVRVRGFDAARLEASGARKSSLQEWLHPLGYLKHASRRLGAPARGDRVSLVTFWELLERSLIEEGLPLSEEAEVRVLAGTPGGFFGRHHSTMIEGRWAISPSPGVWCAYRRGYGEQQWLPTLVSVEGDERRSLDLFDNDEWRWALLARSYAVGPREVVNKVEEEERVTWPIPAQLHAAMDLRGRSIAPWRWRVAENAPDLWSMLDARADS